MLCRLLLGKMWKVRRQRMLWEQSLKSSCLMNRGWFTCDANAGGNYVIELCGCLF